MASAAMVRRGWSSRPVASDVVLPGGHAGSPSPARHRALTLALLFGLFSLIYGVIGEPI
jgi:hypothetical protein